MLSHSPANEHTPPMPILPCDAAMVDFGFRFLVWIPSFFILCGRFTFIGMEKYNLWPLNMMLYDCQRL